MESLSKGKVYQFKRKITQKDILTFAVLTGDFNPLHLNKQFGKQSQFKQNIVHGMLAGSLFSTLIGMHCTGKNSLYLSQTLNFKAPLFPNDKVTVKGTVIAKNKSIRLITLRTEILKKGKVCISGEAKVKILE